MKNKIDSGPFLKRKLMLGVDAVADAVAVTLGPTGRTVIIPKPNNISNTPGGYYMTKDGVSVARSIFMDNPLEDIGAQMFKEIAMNTVTNVGDGPQPLYSKVLTPTGFVKISDLKEGDTICGTNKTFQKVLGIYNKGNKEIFKVSFSNGRTVECSDNHLWEVITSYGVKKIMTLREIMDSGKIGSVKNGSNFCQYYVPTTCSEFLKNDKLPLDPFLVGLLIGDGSLSGTGDIELSLALNQDYLIDRIKLPANIKLTATKNFKKNYIRVKFSRKSAPGPRMFDYVREIGLLGTKSNTKFIPEEYLYNSYENRKALLDGLLETDGHLNKKGLIEYSTVSEKLCNDIVELFRGLGYSARSKTLIRKEGSSYSNTPIHRIYELKGYKHGIKILSIEKTDKIEPTMCIKVSNKDSLYITDDYVLTHNTSTSIILGRALAKYGLEALSEDSSLVPSDLKTKIDKTIQYVIEELDKMAIQIAGDISKIQQVATISANNDREIGELIAEAYAKTGVDGVISLEESRTASTYLTTVEGFDVDSGFYSPYFVTDEAKGKAILENPYILVVEGKLSSIRDLLPLIETVATRDRSLVIFADDFDSQVVDTLVMNQLRGTIKVLLVKTPGFGENKFDNMEDISASVGATPIGERLGHSIENVNLNLLGEASKVTATNDNTVIVNGRADKEKVKNKVEVLKQLEKETTNDYTLEKIKNRISSLTGAVAIIHVGAPSELEMKEKKDRVEDALFATKAAIAEGILPGGGIALLEISKKLGSSEVSTIVKNTLTEPLKTIAFNCGMEPSEVLNTILEKNIQNYGFNGKTKTYGDMFEFGVVDPKKVTRIALENAASVAGMILTTETAVYKK